MQTIKGRKFPVEVLTTDEIQLLLSKCSRRAHTGVRNRALIVCLYRSGLRIAEALALRPKDIDRARGALRVLHGKGNKSRVAGIDASALGYLDHWLKNGRPWGLQTAARCFAH